MIFNKHFFNLSIILISIFPILLISGSFLSDIAATYLGLSFLLYCIYKNQLHFFKNYFTFFFIIIYFYLIINSLIGFNYRVSLHSSLPFFRIILFTLAVGFFVKKFTKIKNIYFKIFFISIFFLLLYSFFILFFKQDLFGNKIIDQDRITSFFGKKAIMGSFVSRLLPLAVGLTYLIKLKNKNVLTLALIFFSGVLVILSGERLAFFYYCVFIFFFITLSIKKNIYVLIIFLFSIVVAFFSNPKSSERIFFHTLNQSTATSNTVFSFRHTLHYVTAYEMFLDRPITGHGLKSFRILCNKFTIKSNSLIELENLINQKNKKLINEYKNGCNTHPHNIYLEFLSELGLIGFVLFSLIFLYSIFQILLFLKLNFFGTKNLTNRQKCLFLILVGVFTNMFPFVPAGSYFNNWILIISYLPIGFYIGIKDLK